MNRDFRFADVQEVFREIERNFPTYILDCDKDTLNLLNADLYTKLDNIRKAIDEHLMIRKPHIEACQ